MESDGLPWLHCPGKFRHTASTVGGKCCEGGGALCEKPGVPASAQPFEGSCLVLSRAHGRPAEEVPRSFRRLLMMRPRLESQGQPSGLEHDARAGRGCQ